MTPNNTLAADLVIVKTPVGWTIWQDDDVVAFANTRKMLELIVAGASARKLSVFDAEAQQFLCGDLAQLEA